MSSLTFGAGPLGAGKSHHPHADADVEFVDQDMVRAPELQFENLAITPIVGGNPKGWPRLPAQR